MDRVIRALPPAHDPLTGLLSPWWWPLRERVRLRFTRPRRRYRRGYLSTFHPERGVRWLVPLPADTVMLDVDLVGFKRFNDRYGLQVGDAVLIETARRIREVVGEWPVYRYGADEFLVIARVPDEQTQAALESRIRDAFRQPFVVSADEASPIDETVDVRIVAARATPEGDLKRLRSDLDVSWAAMHRTTSRRSRSRSSSTPTR